MHFFLKSHNTVPKCFTCSLLWDSRQFTMNNDPILTFQANHCHVNQHIPNSGNQIAGYWRWVLAEGINECEALNGLHLPPSLENEPMWTLLTFVRRPRLLENATKPDQRNQQTNLLTVFVKQNPLGEHSMNLLNTPSSEPLWTTLKSPKRWNARLRATVSLSLTFPLQSVSDILLRISLRDYPQEVKISLTSWG